MSSYATQRKIRLIEAQYGPEWDKKFPNRSIDSIFIELTGDQRKNLFCKIKPELKDKLDEMVDFNQLNMAEMIERIIEDAYVKHAHEKSVAVSEIGAAYGVQR